MPIKLAVLKRVILLLSLIILSSFTSVATAQQPVENRDSIQKILDAAQQRIDEVESFKLLCDSLYISGAYNEIVRISEKESGNTSNPDLKGDAGRMLIAGYYLVGDIKRSDQLFSSYIAGNGGLHQLINSLTFPLNKYFEQNQGAKDLIYARLYEQEGISAKDTLKRAIFSFYLNDQWIRRYFSVFGKNKKDSLSLAYQAVFAKEVDIQNDNVFNFYAKLGRLLTESELGGIWLNQFILFTHENNIERRAFYLKLIKAAVKEDQCPVEREINFILRTELFTDPDFRTKLPARIEQLKKEYNIQDFSYSAY